MKGHYFAIQVEAMNQDKKFSEINAHAIFEVTDHKKERYAHEKDKKRRKRDRIPGKKHALQNEGRAESTDAFGDPSNEARNSFQLE